MPNVNTDPLLRRPFAVDLEVTLKSALDQDCAEPSAESGAPASRPVVVFQNDCAEPGSATGQVAESSVVTVFYAPYPPGGFP